MRRKTKRLLAALFGIALVLVVGLAACMVLKGASEGEASLSFSELSLEQLDVVYPLVIGNHAHHVIFDNLFYRFYALFSERLVPGREQGIVAEDHRVLFGDYYYDSVAFVKAV